ncbi:uncharacterized protein PHALS_02808 [Plasmopara halstedii]|uniref:Uncharacterized protein n=1 Tax=Plasmopara halstedii TaxID=4781 RepID=A0A0P1AXS3_PLAHL|nr:uncharacterized protein PHALS_02808 [Plasmopara halstedii]CEG46405.1 hypothetical protein PHALS_02808 [Plasmopara halstedii]|eukprot:XP_024582774.1 hypothetical protein PHALS_02808 [Plasmopara halstedii]
MEIGRPCDRGFTNGRPGKTCDGQPMNSWVKKQRQQMQRRRDGVPLMNLLVG